MNKIIPRGVAALEAVLESAQETARKSLELAQSIDRREDDCGQDLAYNRAIAFMKVSARVGMALAKLKGEHTSNVTICRTELHAPPPRIASRRPRAATLETPVDNEHAARAQLIADTWMTAHGMKDGDDWPVLYPDSEDDEDYDVDDDGVAETTIGRDGAAGEGDPSRNFRGSNTGK
ncbi:MAG: hypothetical protein WDN01_06470 [Rhizomicrobium sp.]